MRLSTILLLCLYRLLVDKIYKYTNIPSYLQLSKRFLISIRTDLLGIMIAAQVFVSSKRYTQLIIYKAFDI